jgi:hypothetical protein
MRFIFATLALLSLVACAGSKEASTEPTTPEETVAEVQKPWHELEGREKGKFMDEVVVPTMGALLKEHDAEEFAEVGCKTCHGKDPKAAGFELPTPDLPKLNPADNFAEHKEREPEAFKFMTEVFTPKMVEILGEKPYDAATNEGFGCFACHTMKEAPAAADAAPTDEAAAPAE